MLCVSVFSIKCVGWGIQSTPSSTHPPHTPRVPLFHFIATRLKPIAWHRRLCVSVRTFYKLHFCHSFFVSLCTSASAPSVAHSASATLPYHFESHVYRLVVYGHHPVAAAVQCHCVATPHAKEVLGHRPSVERSGGTVRDVPLEVNTRKGAARMELV